MLNLPRDTQWYLRCFWRDCPSEAIDLLNLEVIPAAQQDPSQSATDIILHNSASWLWYQSVPIRTQQRFHKLVGVTVRAARGYRVARTAGGYAAGRGPCGHHGGYQSWRALHRHSRDRR